MRQRRCDSPRPAKSAGGLTTDIPLGHNTSQKKYRRHRSRQRKAGALGWRAVKKAKEARTPPSPRKRTLPLTEQARAVCQTSARDCSPRHATPAPPRNPEKRTEAAPVDDLLARVATREPARQETVRRVKAVFASGSRFLRAVFLFRQCWGPGGPRRAHRA